VSSIAILAWAPNLVCGLATLSPLRSRTRATASRGPCRAPVEGLRSHTETVRGGFAAALSDCGLGQQALPGGLAVRPR
jgi:hypothetical protein